MFTLKMDDAKILNGSVGILSDFITEATFSITREGLKLVAMDPANISMVILNILPSAFTEYSVQNPTEITLNLDAFRQALKRAKSTETITLEHQENKLKITVTGKSVKRFLIPLIEKEGQERKIPELEFNAIIEVNASEFRDYIDDAAIVGDAITFDAGMEKLTMSAGETGRKVTIELSKDSDAIIKMNVKEPVRSIYSIEYLRKMAKASTLSDVTTIQFSKDYPLKLDFKALDTAQMSFILAPRIENK